MHPYFHPTTLLVLDDDAYYVESFKFHFGDQFPCVAYTQPEKAIEHLTSQDKARPRFDRLQDQTSSPVDAAVSDERRSCQHVRRVMADANRFRRVSVLVVDYDMPAMSGLQVCRAIRHLPVRKLLLTGKAGLDVAISAFNEGVIDTFLTKHDPDIQSTLPRQVLRLQDEYFKATTELLGTTLSRGEAPFLTDAGILETLASVMKGRRIVEHYVVDKPPGVVLVDQNGAAMVFVVMDGESLKSHWEVAKENGAPAELLQLLASTRVLPLFPTASGYYEKELAQVWSAYLHPSQRVDQDRVWHTALVPADKAQGALPARIATFAEFEEASNGLETDKAH